LIIWVDDAHLRQVLRGTLSNALELLNAGEVLVEISDIAKQ